MKEKITQYFEEFCEDFGTFDGELIATRFISPLVVVSSEGEVGSYETEKSIASYFQRYLDEYQSKGVVSCVFKELEFSQVNKCSFLATVTWELLNKNSSIEVSWRESYNLVLLQGDLKAFTTYDH